MASTKCSWRILHLTFIAYLLCLALLSLPSRADTTCYCRDNNATKTSCANAVPCSNDVSEVQQCCIAGDQCLESGFCYSGAQPANSNHSGFYMGGCTDSDFKDPRCPLQCTNLNSQEVVYNNDSNSWACCYTGDGVTCNSPNSESFKDPSPQELLATPYLSAIAASSTKTSTATASAISPSTAGQSATSSPSPTSSPSSSSGLSTGASAGIGVGVAVVGIAIIAMLVLFILRSRKRKRGEKAYEMESNNYGTEVHPGGGSGKTALGRKGMAGHQRSELDGQNASELDGQAQVRSELE